VRAGRYLRKFYPWYVERLAGRDGGPARPGRLEAHEAKRLQQALQATSEVGEARAVLNGVRRVPAAA
jgi:hypothetical protein